MFTTSSVHDGETAMEVTDSSVHKRQGINGETSNESTPLELSNTNISIAKQSRDK
jgi:hypothetical protein